MVSSTMLDYIHRRLCTIKDSEAKFGGLNMILRPIRGYYAFENPYLWSSFQPFFLEENVRQSVNFELANLLNRARVGALTKNNITVLNSRVLSVPEMELENIIHIYPKVKQVTKHNCLIQSRLKYKTSKILAKHYFSQHDLNPKSVVNDSMIPNDDRNAGGLLNRLEISVGTRVMLIRNIHASHGLVNGVMGFVASVDFNDSNDVTLIY
ncbi:hypothetical protein KUTeg_021835, partial [Tegillarca granosa]